MVGTTQAVNGYQPGAPARRNAIGLRPLSGFSRLIAAGSHHVIPLARRGFRHFYKPSSAKSVHLDLNHQPGTSNARQSMMFRDQHWRTDRNADKASHPQASTVAADALKIYRNLDSILHGATVLSVTPVT